MSGGKVLQASLVAMAAMLLPVPSSAVQLSLLSLQPSQCPRSVAEVLSPSVPEGADLCLDGMLVAARSGDGNWLFVRDPYERADGPLLAVYSSAPVERYWSVEIHGYKKAFSLPGSVRTVTAVIPRRLRLYVDSQGRPFLLYVKNPVSADREWCCFRELPVPVIGDGATTLDEVPLPPEPEQAPPPSEPSTPVAGSIAWALRQPVGTAVTINDVVCTADSPRPGYAPADDHLYDFVDYLYAQEPDRTDQQANRGRSAGIKVNWTSSTARVYRGDGIRSITGVIALRDGEKQIDQAVVDSYGAPVWSPSRPLGMNNRSIGGNDIAPDALGVANPYGLYNKGLLIRTSGRVTYVDPAGSYCYIDDGSHLQDGSGQMGVKALLARQGPNWVYDEVPQVGQYIAVTGISSSEIISGQPARVVRQRSDFGRMISRSPVYTAWSEGRGLITTESGATYVTLFGGAYDRNLYQYEPGLPLQSYWLGHGLGCLDIDIDGVTFWGGWYESGIICRVFQHSLTPPFPQLVQLDLPWVANDPINRYRGDLDGLAVASDGTLWISSDQSIRVYHIDRSGNRISSLDMSFPVTGHEYVGGFLWLASMPSGSSNFSTVYKVDPGNGSVLARFNTTDRVEDLDWRAGDPWRLRGFTANTSFPAGNAHLITWEFAGVEVVSQ